MRVMVALEDRFFRTQNGNVYSNTIGDYKNIRGHYDVTEKVQDQQDRFIGLGDKQ